MATNLSSNKYVGETPKVGDCVCVRGHKPIAMGEILVVNALGPVDSVHVGLGADHGVVGASSAGHSMIVTVAPIRSAARSVAALHGCPILSRHRGTSENFHQLALRPPRAIGEAEPSGTNTPRSQRTRTFSSVGRNRETDSAVRIRLPCSKLRYELIWFLRRQGGQRRSTAASSPVRCETPGEPCSTNSRRWVASPRSNLPTGLRRPA